MYRISSNGTTLSKDEQVAAQSFGGNVATLVQKGVPLPVVLLTLGEFLGASEKPDFSEANTYLINWARAENI